MQYIRQDLKQNQSGFDSLAVIGMGISWCGWSLDEFEHRVYQGQLSPVYEGHLCLPSSDLGHSPSGLIEALRNAQLPPGTPVAIVSNLVDTNWIKEANPLVILQQASPATSLLEQLEIAQALLAETVEVVLLGVAGNESAAIVLTTLETAQRIHSRVYATINAVGLARCTSVSKSALSGAITQSCQQSLAQANVTAAAVGYLELWHGNLPDEAAAETTSLLEVYKTNEGNLTCAVGTVRVNLESSPIVSMASLIKTVLCLYHRYIPATPQLASPYLDAWQASCFYTPVQSRPWFVTAGPKRRYAAVNLLEANQVGHLILTEAPSPEPLKLLSFSSTPNRSTYLAQSSPYLLPITAADPPALLAVLAQLRQTLATATSLSDTVRHVFAQFQQRQSAYIVVILGQTQAELLAEIELAFEGITVALATGKDWKTPMGSYFTPKPLGKAGQLAYVYPGAFNSYVGLGQHLFRLFPALHQVAATYVSDIGAVMRERLLYPRRLGSLSRAELGQLDEQLMADPLAMLGSGMSYATLLTAALRDYFQLRPQAVFGYSLGEISMMCAHSVWSNYDQGVATLNTSSLFQSRLAGPMQAIREYWGIDHTSNGLDNSANHPIWSSYVIRATLSQVTDYVNRYERVYITHINTANEIVIAGDAQACLRLTKQIKRDLKCDTFRAPATGVLHCDAVRSEYDELVKLNLLPVQSVSDITFYSAANYQPIPLDSPTIAHNIAKGLCQQLDFPRLVNRVYDDGARIFLEVGAGSSCSRWLQDILQKRPHLVIPLNKRGVDDQILIVKALAQLVSHQVPLDLSSLYHPVVTQHHPVATQPNSTNLVIEASEVSIKESTKVSTKVNTKTSIPKHPQSAQLPQHSLHSSCSQGTPMSDSAPHTHSGAGIIHSDQVAQLHKLHHLQQQNLSANLSQFNQVHLAFLKSRRESFRQLCQVSQLQLQVSRMLVSQPAILSPKESPPQEASEQKDLQSLS